MSLMLELHSSGTVPDQYMRIFPFLLVPALWERPANIHPLVRLIQAFISRGSAQVQSHAQVIQFLIKKKYKIEYLVNKIATSILGRQLSIGNYTRTRSNILLRSLSKTGFYLVARHQQKEIKIILTHQELRSST